MTLSTPAEPPLLLPNSKKLSQEAVLRNLVLILKKIPELQTRKVAFLSNGASNVRVIPIVEFVLLFDSELRKTVVGEEGAPQEMRVL